MDTGTIVQIIGVLLEKLEHDYQMEINQLRQSNADLKKEREELLRELETPKSDVWVSANKVNKT